MRNRMLPQANYAEESVIGTIFTYPDSIYNVLSILTPEMFYDVVLKNTYQACLDLIQSGQPVDLISVTKDKIDSVPYLTGLTGRVLTDQLIENHAQIIKEKYLLRKYIQPVMNW